MEGDVNESKALIAKVRKQQTDISRERKKFGC